MKEEQNRVEKTKRKKRTKTVILIILFLLVIGGGVFALENSKNLFSDHTAKSKHVSISSETKESKSKSSTSSSHVSNRDESKKEVDTTDLSNEQVVEWINYVVDNWEKANNIAWPYTVDRLNDLNGRDSNSIYYSIIFQNPKYPMMILRINSDGFMEFETNTVDATKNKNFEYKVLSKKYKDISLINDLDASELTRLPDNTSQASQVEASNNQDLDIEAINNGDISTLTGTWRNGNGDVLIINSDGTTNKSYTVHTLVDSDKKSKIPYAGLSDGKTGSALGLYKIGFENPDGDQSDKTRPRLTIAQQSGNYEASAYYYRQ